MYIHEDGIKFIVISVIISVIAFCFSNFLGFLFSVVALWVISFFRNPKPLIPLQDNLIISPASGKIVGIASKPLPKELGFDNKEYNRISIFLNIFDVHVNRYPVSGRVKKIVYNPGKFFNASFDKASDNNERNTILLSYNQGRVLALTQIAGLIARRIRCDASLGDEAKIGHEYGIIRFGSRVDLYLEKDIKILTKVGDRVFVGRTILAQFENL